MTAVTAVALGGALAALWFVFNDAQRRQLDAALLELSVAVARDAARPEPLPPRLPEHPGPVANDVELPKFAVVYDDRGQAVAKTSTVASPPALSDLRGEGLEVFDFDLDGRRLRGVLRSVPGGAMTVLVATTRSDVDGDATLLAKVMGLVFLLSWGCASLSAAWAVGRMTRQHEAVRAVARRVADGELEARLAETARDDDRQLTNDINRMVERLAHLVWAQRRFVAHAAHELRSPLTALSGELQRALARPRAPEEYREAIGDALEETSRLSSLTDDLLAFAGIGTAARRGMAPVNLARVVEGVLGAVAIEASASGTALVFESDTFEVLGHEGDLSRLVRNLVENALRHGGPGGRVRVRLGTKSGTAMLLVEDEGPGVAPSEREAVFEPFYRNPRARGQGVRGAGLGLAIAREIARAHGGDLRVDPSYAGGGRFVVSLPLLPRPPGDDEGS